jgi:hypothetical protein
MIAMAYDYYYRVEGLPHRRLTRWHHLPWLLLLLLPLSLHLSLHCCSYRIDLVDNEMFAMVMRIGQPNYVVHQFDCFVHREPLEQLEHVHEQFI